MIFNTMRAIKKLIIVTLSMLMPTTLMAQYEKPIHHACDVQMGQVWVSEGGQRPEGFCPSAWDSLSPIVTALARGEGNFYDGWMKNPYSAMISCNDGFRPVSFYAEVAEEA